MPEIGDKITSQELGLNITKRKWYIYHPCPDCGEPRWVPNTISERNRRCKPCGRKFMAMGKISRGKYAGLEKRRGSTLGFNYKRDTWFFKENCPECGKEMWRPRYSIGRVCFDCACKKRSELFSNRFGADHPQWKGGRQNRPDGYINITLSPDSPFYGMAHKKAHTVLEHRLVMAESLDRPLESWEVVHHINGIKNDNRLENLELLPSGKEHLSDMLLKAKIQSLEKRVTLLEAENVLLKAQGLKE